MVISYVPVLPALRELYAQPRTMDRFRAYLDALTGGTDDVVLPIGHANPMAKEQALAALDRLIALGADAIGAAAAEEAQQRLSRLPLTDSQTRPTSDAHAQPSRGAQARPSRDLQTRLMRDARAQPIRDSQ